MMKFSLLFANTFTLVSFYTSCTQDSKSQKHFFGEVDADEIDIASRLPGRVKKILVHEGQRVKVGDVLVEFEDDVMAAKKAGALATIKAAESKRDIAQNAVRPEEKEQLASALSVAKKQVEFAKSSLSRMELLLKEGAIAQQAFDEVVLKYQSAVENYNAMSARMRLANVGARSEEKNAAEALVSQAKTLLSEVEAYEKDLSLKSPIDGEIFQIISKESELVPQGYPVVTLLKVDQPRIVVNVSENDLKRFSMDKDVWIDVPALNKKKIQGKVSYIAAMGNFATKNFTQDKSNFDIRTFEVRILVKDSIEGMRPGMTAIADPNK